MLQSGCAFRAQLARVVLRHACSWGPVSCIFNCSHQFFIAFVNFSLFCIHNVDQVSLSIVYKNTIRFLYWAHFISCLISCAVCRPTSEFFICFFQFPNYEQWQGLCGTVIHQAPRREFCEFYFSRIDLIPHILFNIPRFHLALSLTYLHIITISS